MRYIRSAIVGVGIGAVLSMLGIHIMEQPWVFLLACAALNALAELNRMMA